VAFGPRRESRFRSAASICLTAIRASLRAEDVAQIGPDTVNTMPDATIEGARDHATPARTVDQDVDQAHKLIEEVKAAGVDFDEIVLEQLVDEGVKSFSDSYESLLDAIKDKASELVRAG
jgi:transaldolase / glucose-6-phosphate isomerase